MQELHMHSMKYGNSFVKSESLPTTHLLFCCHSCQPQANKLVNLLIFPIHPPKVFIVRMSKIFAKKQICRQPSFIECGSVVSKKMYTEWVAGWKLVRSAFSYNYKSWLNINYNRTRTLDKMSSVAVVSAVFAQTANPSSMGEKSSHQNYSPSRLQSS